MIKIIIFSFITNLMFYSYGHLLKNKKSSNKIESYNQISILGCILISFIALFINFFFPLNEIFNTILLVLGLIYFLTYILIYFMVNSPSASRRKHVCNYKLGNHEFRYIEQIYIFLSLK